jgi:hypothetical protein
MFSDLSHPPVGMPTFCRPLLRHRWVSAKQTGPTSHSRLARNLQALDRRSLCAGRPSPSPPRDLSRPPTLFSLSSLSFLPWRTFPTFLRSPGYGTGAMSFTIALLRRSKCSKCGFRRSKCGPGRTAKSPSYRAKWSKCVNAACICTSGFRTGGSTPRLRYLPAQSPAQELRYRRTFQRQPGYLRRLKHPRGRG